MVLAPAHLLPTSIESVSEKHKKPWEIILGPGCLLSLKIGFTFCLMSNIKFILSQIDINHMILPEQDQSLLIQRSFAEADRALFNLHK